MNNRSSERYFSIGAFVVCCAGACSGTPGLGDVTDEVGGNGGAVAIGGSSATGGTHTGGVPGTGGGLNCETLVTTLECVKDDDCCLVASARCEIPLWLVTRSESSALSTCLTQSTSYCSSCMGVKVQVACEGGQCVGTNLGMDMTWPPSGLSAPHCGKLPIGTGNANATGGAHSTGSTSASPAAAPAGEVAASIIKFGCG